MVWIAVIIGVILLIIFPKQMLSIIGILVLVVVAIIFYFQEQDNQRQREKDRILVSIKYDTEKCGEDFPLLVVIQNTGNKTVNKVSWNFAAYKPGYSSNVVSYGSNSYSWGTPYSTDKILKTREGYAICYKVPNLSEEFDSAKLHYEITNKNIVFEN